MCLSHSNFQRCLFKPLPLSYSMNLMIPNIVYWQISIQSKHYFQKCFERERNTQFAFNCHWNFSFPRSQILCLEGNCNNWSHRTGYLSRTFCRSVGDVMEPQLFRVAIGSECSNAQWCSATSSVCDGRILWNKSYQSNELNTFTHLSWT